MAKITTLILSPEAEVPWASEVRHPVEICAEADNIGVLRWVVTNYENLPEQLVVLPDYHNYLKRDGGNLGLVNSGELLRVFMVSGGRYWNWNKQLLGSLTRYQAGIKGSGWWQNCMAATFGEVEEQADFVEGWAGSEQFIVGRGAIRQRPLLFYRQMLEWLDQTLGAVEDEEARRKLRFNLSLYLGLFWPPIFGYQEESWTLPDGRVLRAYYGIPSRSVNITARLKALSDNQGQKGVEIPTRSDYNALFGDPCMGTVKELRVLIDDELVVTITEGGVVKL